MALRRQTVLGLSSGAVILAAISGLGMYHHLQTDPDAVKKEFEPRLAEWNRIPDRDLARKDKVAEELLDHPLYKEHAKALWLKLDKAHKPIHDALKIDQAAQKDVTGFLARSRMPGGDVRTLEAEARTLILNYGQTRFGDDLRQEQERLRKILDSMEPFGPADFIALQRDVRKAAKEGRYAAAMALIDDAVKKHPTVREYDQKFEELRGEIRKKAEAGAAKFLEQLPSLNRATAIEQLEKALPDYDGFPQRKTLELKLRELKRP